MHNHYGFWRFVWDLFLTIMTGGLWLLYLMFRYLHRK